MIDTDFANLNGRKAVVTGSSTGIGQAIAWELALAGADVLIHYHRSLDAAHDLAEKIQQQLDQTAAVLKADFEKRSELDEFVQKAWSSLQNVDIWVNNAGVDLLTGDQAQLPYDQKLEKLLEIDVRSTVLLSREAGQRMKKAGGGVILNIGWDQAEHGMEGDSGELFATSKNAIMGFTRSLSLSLAPEVRVNCIAPGWIRTAWGAQASKKWQQRVSRETPLRRWGEPEDIAALARFLVSSQASYITGQVIYANGGAVR